MNIIVIDDEIDLLNVYVSLLESQGFCVESFSNSEMALERIKKNKFDLIITDKKMPNVSGLDIFKYVENSELNTPVFMITGDNQDVIESKNPSSMLFKKPVKFKVILDAIKELEVKTSLEAQ